MMKSKIFILLAWATLLMQACTKKDLTPGADSTAGKTGHWVPGQPLVSGTYTIININSGKSLDVINASTANNALLQQWGYINPNVLVPNAQKWTIVNQGGGYYRVVNVNSNKAVDVPNGATTNGLQLQQFDFIGANSQVWKIENVGFDLYKFTNKATGKVMAVKNSSTANGAQIVQETYNATQSQWFQIRQTAYKDIAATNFFRRTSGITATDGGHTLKLPDGRVLWLFSDSWINGYDAGTGTVPCNLQVNNVASIQNFDNWNGAQASTMLGSGNPPNLFKSNSAPGFVNWTGAAVQLGDTTYVYLTDPNGTGSTEAWGKLKLSQSNNVVGYKTLPATSGLKFSILVKGTDGYVYAYASKLNFVEFTLYVARFSQSNPNGPWTYWNGSSWISNSAQAAAVVTSYKQYGNVSKIGTKYVLMAADVSSCNGTTNNDLYAATSSSPTGPFTTLKSIYTIDDRIQGYVPFFYIPVAHPEYVNSNNELLVTYNVWGAEPCTPKCVSGRMNPDIYRPKAIRVPLSMIDPSFN